MYDMAPRGRGGVEPLPRMCFILKHRLPFSLRDVLALNKTIEAYCQTGPRLWGFGHDLHDSCAMLDEGRKAPLPFRREARSAKESTQILV
jgi:hypothetical protein